MRVCLLKICHYYLIWCCYRIYDNHSVTIYDNHSVTIYDNHTVTIYDNHSVTIYDNHSVTIYDNPSVTIYDNHSYYSFDLTWNYKPITNVAVENATLNNVICLTVEQS